MSQVDIVLFVRGRGSDKASFRPNRDETQWWNRRDALVRCIASFLFGPHSDKMRKSVILLFDEDWTRIRLELKDGARASFLPIEKNVIFLIKKATEAVPGTTVEDHGLEATLILPQTIVSNDLPSSLDSKRS